MRRETLVGSVSSLRMEPTPFMRSLAPGRARLISIVSRTRTITTGRTAPLLLLTLAFTTACGYVMSGNLEDYPKNWKRAFQSVKPPDVVVVHSKYWRSPHWTLEFEYFFEIAPNAALKTQLFTANKLRRVEGEEAERVRAKIFGDGPAWFAPKATSTYEVWVFDDEPERNFKVLVDKSSGHMFINDFQV